MGDIVFAGIIPHDLCIIESLAGEDKNLFIKTRASIEQVTKKFIEEKPDVIIVLTPHGLRLRNYTAVYTTEYCSGSFTSGNQCESLTYKCSKALSENILLSSEKENISVVGCNYGALEGPHSNIAMDWGTFVPLWFLKELQETVEVVVIGPTRDTSLEELELFGKIIANEIENTDKRVGIIASADQGHCHSNEGPYGYNPASKIYDSFINKCLKEDNLKDVIKVNKEIVENGKPDSLWQMVILSGALRKTDLSAEFMSYEAPTYFGMTVAGFFRR